MQRMGPRGFLTDEEKNNLPTVSWALIRRIPGYLAPYWSKFVLVFITIILSSVLGLLPSIITGRIVDEALIGESMKLLIQLLLAALTASQLVSLLTTYLNAWISQHIIFDMKNQMYGHLQRMSHVYEVHGGRTFQYTRSLSQRFILFGNAKNVIARNTARS